jgi:hypothetical protein
MLHVTTIPTSLSIITSEMTVTNQSGKLIAKATGVTVPVGE